MELVWRHQILLFESVILQFEAGHFENVFAYKNNKTVKETLAHGKYRKFEKEVLSKYAQYLNWGLGSFLSELKAQGDIFFLKFLNSYGDKKYSRFYIEDKHFLTEKGLYLYSIENECQYIGRCRDTFRKRINQGYGKIHPKNCYIDGQATNCHLNALITEQREKVRFWVHPMKDDDIIEAVERDLIKNCNPPWNLALIMK